MNRAVLFALAFGALVLPFVAGCGKEYPENAIANSVYADHRVRDATQTRVVTIWFYGPEWVKNVGVMVPEPNCTVAYYAHESFGSAGAKPEALFRGYYSVTPDGRVAVSFSPNPKYDWLNIDWIGDLKDEDQTIDFGPNGVFTNVTAH